MNGRQKFEEWAEHRDEVVLEHGPRQSHLGGKQVLGSKQIEEDEVSVKERYERSEAFLHRKREAFPED